MPDLTIDVDASAVDAALAALPAALEARTNAACQQTAVAIVREAQSRLGRQLKGTSVATKDRPDLGQHLTLSGIHAQPAYDGHGWVVLSDREPFPNVPLWLEKGTRAGQRANVARTAPEKYFYPAITLELGSFEQRLLTAMADAASDVGLGT